MRVSNEPGGPAGPTGAFAEMFRLQADFQARLAEETLRYLRRLQGAVVPAAPGTVVMPGQDSELRATATPGAQAELTLEVENLQRVHCMVTPQLTPLVAATGVTWFPSVESATASKLVPPGAVEVLRIGIAVPPELPHGEYRGALLLQGFRQNSLPVVVTVRGASPEKPITTKPGPAKPTKPIGPLKPVKRTKSRSRRKSS